MRFFQHRSKEAKGNLPMIILSLLLAILIWLVVAMTLYPSIPKTIENIPLSVDIAGSPAADSGLSVISCDVDTVDVQLVGSRTQIGNLNEENLEAAKTWTSSDAAALKDVAKNVLDKLRQPGTTRLNIGDAATTIARTFNNRLTAYALQAEQKYTDANGKEQTRTITS